MLALLIFENRIFCTCITVFPMNFSCSEVYHCLGAGRYWKALGLCPYRGGAGSENKVPLYYNFRPFPFSNRLQKNLISWETNTRQKRLKEWDLFSAGFSHIVKAFFFLSLFVFFHSKLYKLKQKNFVVESGPRADLEFCFQFVHIFQCKNINLEPASQAQCLCTGLTTLREQGAAPGHETHSGAGYVEPLLEKLLMERIKFPNVSCPDFSISENLPPDGLKSRQKKGGVRGGF